MVLTNFGFGIMSQRKVSSRAFRRFLEAASIVLRVFHLRGVSEKLGNWLAESRSQWSRRLESELLASLTSGEAECFVDLGAHVGEQAIVAAKYMPVFAFEPDPIAIDKLEAHIRRSKPFFPINVIKKAATNFDGVTNLYGHKNGPQLTGSSSLNQAKTNVSDFEKCVVEACDIGKFIKDLPFQRLIIKCDVEGAEYEVIESLGVHGVFDRVILMFTEFHDAKIPGQWRKSLKMSLWNRRKWGIKSGQLVEWL